jgi:hypothetical protein
MMLTLITVTGIIIRSLRNRPIDTPTQTFGRADIYASGQPIYPYTCSLFHGE